MKKMLKISYKDLRDALLVTVAIFAFIAACFWYGISSYSYNEYVRICHANYGTSGEFDQCMKPYWNQYNIGKPAITISFVVLAASAGLLVVTELKRRLRR